MALPLEGVRVLDLTSVMAGPYCTMVLGDMGAEVIKVENFPEGAASRRFDPKVNDESYCFAVLNRNKKSIGLNMKDPRDKVGAYIGRLRTGNGQYIETSLLEAGLAWTHWESGAYFGSGELPTIRSSP